MFYFKDEVYFLIEPDSVFSLNGSSDYLNNLRNKFVSEVMGMGSD